MIIYTRVNLPKFIPFKKANNIFIERERKKTAKIVDKSADIAEIVDELIVVNQTDTFKLTASYIGQTGLEAVMKRVAITGDISLLNTISSETEEGILDATKLPGSLGEVKALADNAKVLKSSLPAELLKGRSIDEFLKSDIDSEIASYIEYLKGQNGGNNNE